MSSDANTKISEMRKSQFFINQVFQERIPHEQKNGNWTNAGFDFYRFHGFHKRFAMFWTEMSKPTSRRKRFSQKPSDVALELGPLTFDPWVAKGTLPLTRDLLGSGPEPWQWCLHPELDPGTWAMSLDLWPQTSCLMKMHWIHLRSYELQFEM